MAIENVTTQFINNAFSKGLIDDKWDNRMPNEYSPDLRNVRVRNNVLSVRKWFKDQN